MSGGTAVSLGFGVTRLVDEGHGRRFPDLHVDGYERVLGLPVWGRVEGYSESFSTYEPDLMTRY